MWSKEQPQFENLAIRTSCYALEMGKDKFRNPAIRRRRQLSRRGDEWITPGINPLKQSLHGAPTKKLDQIVITEEKQH